MNGELTRLKLVIGGCILFGLEAGISGLWTPFPFLELVSAQGGLILAYLGAKSFTTRAMAKYGSANERISAGEAEGK